MKLLHRMIHPLALSLLFAVAVMAAERSPTNEPPSRASVEARALRELPEWQNKLPPSRPRLFFDATSWQGLRARYQSAQGREKDYFEAVLVRARRITERPVPNYRSPAEMVKSQAHLTLSDAEQELWQRPVGDNMVALSLALALREDAAIRATLHETVLAACSYPQWGFAHPNEDLSAGHIARGIAIAYDWHPELWTSADRDLIRSTIRTRMEAMKNITYGGIFWAGHYDENHDQVSVAGLGLCGLAFLGEIPEAAEWTALALTNFESVARESHPDGSSDEGIPYWSYGLSFTLQYIEGTRHVLGTDALYQQPYFRNAIISRLNASSPDLGGALPWGDAPPRDYYGPHHLLYRLAAEYRDGSGQFLATHLPFSPGGGADCAVWTALWFDPTVSEKSPTEVDHHAAAGGIVTTRSGWGSADYLLSFKAGFTNRNHSHLDAGAVAFSFGRDWLMTTPGYGQGSGDPAYWDKAAGRWTYQANATESESTLLINGHNQRFTTDARGKIDSYLSSPDWLWTSADLTTAYDDVSRVRRNLLHRRGDYILVLDEVSATQPVSVEWLAQVPPSAKIYPDQLTVTASGGSLALHPMLPATARFAPRPPTSEHLDVAETRMKTFALAQSGTELQFAVALVPAFQASQSTVKNLGAKSVADGEKFLLVGDDWEDHITVNFSPAATARVLATRYVEKQLRSVVAIHATEVTAADFTLHFAEASDVALTLSPDGLWVLDASTPLVLTEPLPEGWRAAELSSFSDTGESVVPLQLVRSPTSLPAGRYVLLRQNQAIDATRAWLETPPTRAAVAGEK